MACLVGWGSGKKKQGYTQFSNILVLARGAWALGDERGEL